MKIFDVVIDYELVKSFNLELLKKRFILPIKKDGIYLDCFTCSYSDTDSFSTNLILRENEIPKEQLLFFLNDIEIREQLFVFSNKSLHVQNNNSNYIEAFFNRLLEKAVLSRSSDIHIEALEKTMIIRFRIDGILKIFFVLNKNFSKVISSYIKMLSKLDITNTRTPMDGRFTFLVTNEKFDFRVSFVPTIDGESIVIRVLDGQNNLKTIDNLGFSSDILDSIKKIIKLNQGLVLVTGPTGSGKSTTLYSILDSLNDEGKKIITVEDPVEYKIKQVQQIEVNTEIGLGFDSILRNILRQDPDVILIGEIRDKTSLSIALQASLTGHLVLASIHSNNSVETLDRLIDLKADRFLLSSTLKYIISQRLILNICKKCNNKGCEFCNFSGFYGRSSISEVLEIDNELSSLILSGASIKGYLKKKKFRTMYDDALLKVANDITTREEVYKVVEKI